MPDYTNWEDFELRGRAKMSLEMIKVLREKIEHYQRQHDEMVTEMTRRTDANRITSFEQLAKLVSEGCFIEEVNP